MTGSRLLLHKRHRQWRASSIRVMTCCRVQESSFAWFTSENSVKFQVQWACVSWWGAKRSVQCHHLSTVLWRHHPCHTCTRIPVFRTVCNLPTLWTRCLWSPECDELKRSNILLLASYLKPLGYSQFHNFCPVVAGWNVIKSHFRLELFPSHCSVLLSSQGRCMG